MAAVESAIRAEANAVPCQTKSCVRMTMTRRCDGIRVRALEGFLRCGSRVVLNSLTAGAGRWRHADLTRRRDRR